jgi:DsbC/DsbD-like thiol-disulfide interchange protein
MKIINISNCLLILMILSGLTACSKKEQSSAQVLTPELNVKLTEDKLDDDSRSINVIFSVAEGWHIYGPNPQNNGRPTSITSENAALSFDKIEWPPTKTFDEGDSGPSEGYDGSFSARSRISPSKEYSSILVKVTWVACKDICVPGEANLSREIN